MESLQISQKDGFTVVQLDHGKVNAIDAVLARDLRQAFTELEADDTVKGVLLQGRPGCFSAGLNLMAMVQGGMEGAATFWREYLGALQTMVRFSKPLVCAITGFAPAGATILALCADYRVMTQGPKHVLGMNEFKVSLQIPEMLCDIFAYYLGEVRAWEAVQKAETFHSDEALALGLVNESAPEYEVLHRAETHLHRMMHIHLPVYQQSKAYLRKDLLRRVDRDIEPMIQDLMHIMKDPELMKSIQQFFMNLKK